MNIDLLNPITERIIGAAIKVHRTIGPGLLEPIYSACFAHELARCGLRVEREKSLPLIYDHLRFDCGYRLDLLIEDQIIIEIKAVEKIIPVHASQLLSYLRLSGCPLGLLINFNVPSLKDGISRIANNYITTSKYILKED